MSVFPQPTPTRPGRGAITSWHRVALWVALFALPALAASAADPVFPLKVSASHRYFVDQNGQPFRLNCEAAWMLSVQATTEEVNAYLDDRAGKGFNSIILMAMVHPGDYTEFSPNCPRNRHGHAPQP